MRELGEERKRSRALEAKGRDLERELAAAEGNLGREVQRGAALAADVEALVQRLRATTTTSKRELQSLRQTVDRGASDLRERIRAGELGGGRRGQRPPASLEAPPAGAAGAASALQPAMR